MEALIGLGTSLCTESITWLLGKTIEHIGYLCNYKGNLNSLEAAVKELDDKRTNASHFAEDIERKCKDVSGDVVSWRSEADQLDVKAQQIVSENSISCLNPCSRYSTSKQASKLVQEINEHVKTAPDFGTSFDRATPKVAAKFDLTGFMEFESRASVVDQVLEAFKDENVMMCSLCGMGGTGKTTLAKKLIDRAETDHLFDKVAMVAVSENPNPTKIRGGIVSSLGWKFDSQELETPDKLSDCLMNNDGSILLILDDVWEVLDFEEIGLPKARLQILFTSRNEDVCQIMGSERNFVINVLTDEEAWGLFKNIAIESIEKWNLHDTARKISDECGGLPVVIVTLAAALKYKTKPTWNDSLLKLQKSNLEDISGMDKVYSRIQLSYDLLNDKEAQSCFRLCCLFPEDYDVPVEYLVLFGNGLRLFKHVESLEQARDRVESIISNLRKSFLLLDGEADGTVKMHDILRDFAISISSKDKHPYIVRCEKIIKKWPDTSQLENCSAISFVCDKIEKHPVDMRCPKLELLHLILNDNGIPIGFFEGMKELKVLLLKVTSLLPSGDKKFDGIFSVLTKLRTLVIYETSPAYHETKVGDLLGHDVLQDLEILEWSGDRYDVSYDDFPEEIGGLCNLRRLKLSKMKFNYIPPHILSKLKELEELELPCYFDEWGCKEANGERVNAGLEELESLPLTTLKIFVPEGSNLAVKLVENLTRFHVCLGRSCYYYSEECYSAVLEVVDVDAIDVTVSWISVLLRKCEQLQLYEVRNLMNIMCLQSADNGFPQLKYLEVRV
ncbi:disease resistance protein At4g27190-like [Euphorbia lathyris]|uniref:disease resistance protein At4g27190-like n=1 Tax=Euphorbia lathyris TaxID=212925 RepID=UPI0033139B3E